MPNAIHTAYCTNVHPGTSLESVLRNLDEHSLKVRSLLIETGQIAPTESLGLGLWFSDSVSRELMEDGNLDSFRDRLQQVGILPFTLNGFPQGDFHQKVVKHAVYRPEWWRPERLEYTQRLIRILDRILPPGEVGSISTLPIGWPEPASSADRMQLAANHFLAVAEHLENLEERTGRRIVLAIEPEPGCAIGDAASLRRFFETHLFVDTTIRQRVCRYLTVCHDICHSAVMDENQADELKAYRDLGMQIGKVQVSSAVEVDWDDYSRDDRNPDRAADDTDVAHLNFLPSGRTSRRAVLDFLRSFAEDRYLHQTMVIDPQSSRRQLHEDLPQLIGSINDPDLLIGRWRIHFHVPIFHESVGLLGTTRSEIQVCLDQLWNHSRFDPGFFTGHFEIETYAWSVLPPALRKRSLADEVADEFRWFLRQLRQETDPALA